MRWLLKSDGSYAIFYYSNKEDTKYSKNYVKKTNMNWVVDGGDLKLVESYNSYHLWCHGDDKRQNIWNDIIAQWSIEYIVLGDS